MIINDNTEIASLLRGPFRSISIKAGPCFARAYQNQGNAVEADKVYVTFKHYGRTSFDLNEFNAIDIFTCDIEDCPPIFIFNFRMMDLNDLLFYMANTMHDINDLRGLITRERMGKSDQLYEATCRSLRSYWDYCPMRMSLPVRFINTIQHHPFTFIYQDCDTSCLAPLRKHNITFETSRQTFIAELAEGKRDAYQ